MEKTQKYTDVIVKLNRLTKEGKLMWEEASSISEKKYRTRHQNKYFVVSQALPNPLTRESDAARTDSFMDLLMNKIMSKATLAIEAAVSG